MSVVPPPHSQRPLLQRRHPALPLLVAMAMFGFIFVLRLAVEGTDARITALYVIPIALLAVVFGLRVGVLAGATGVILTVAWVALAGVSPTALGWVSRLLPLVLVALVTGQVSDHLRAAAVAEQESFAARLGEIEASEIRHSVLAHLAVARQSFENGQVGRGMDALKEGIAAAESLVTLLSQDPPDPEHAGPAGPAYTLH